MAEPDVWSSERGMAKGEWSPATRRRGARQDERGAHRSPRGGARDATMEELPATSQHQVSMRPHEPAAGPDAWQTSTAEQKATSESEEDSGKNTKE